MTIPATPAALARAKNLKIPSGELAFIENTGDQAALLREQNLKWKEGFDTFHNCEDGVFMVRRERE